MGRRGIDNGMASTIKWLSDWYGDLDDVEVNVISLPVYRASPETILSDQDYLAANIGKQTPLHAYLKFQVFKWCQEQHGIESPEYEMKMYFPIDELIDLMKEYGVRTVGRDFDIEKPQLLHRLKEVEHEFRDCSNGDVIIVDVFSNRIVYEIGYTTPFNLFTPILEGLADRAVWIPFPKGVEPKLFDLCNSADSVFHGYEITLIG